MIKFFFLYKQQKNNFSKYPFFVDCEESPTRRSGENVNLQSFSIKLVFLYALLRKISHFSLTLFLQYLFLAPEMPLPKMLKCKKIVFYKISIRIIYIMYKKSFKKLSRLPLNTTANLSSSIIRSKKFSLKTTKNGGSSTLRSGENVKFLKTKSNKRKYTLRIQKKNKINKLFSTTPKTKKNYLPPQATVNGSSLRHEESINPMRKKNKILHGAKRRVIPIFSGGVNPNNKSSLVKPSRVYGRFYANWCGHCKNMAKDWAELIQDKLFLKDAIMFDVEDKDQDKHIPKIKEYTNDKNIKVDGYPTIFKIINGVTEYYNGEKTKEKLREWFTK